MPMTRLPDPEPDFGSDEWPQVEPEPDSRRQNLVARVGQPPSSPSFPNRPRGDKLTARETELTVLHELGHAATMDPKDIGRTAKSGHEELTNEAAAWDW